METGHSLLTTELLERDNERLERRKYCDIFCPEMEIFRLETQSTGVWKQEHTMDRRVEMKKIVTKTARAKDKERGQEDLLAAEQQGDKRKGVKGGKSRIPMEELSREKGKRTKQERTTSDKKERKRLMPVLIVNHRCSFNRWEAAPEYFQFLALHWHAVSAAQPALDGSQVAHESNLLLRRCKSRRMVTHMHHRFRRKYGRSG